MLQSYVEIEYHSITHINYVTAFKANGYLDSFLDVEHLVLHGCRLRTPGAERGRDPDKSTALLYQVRLTTASKLVAFV